MNLASTLRSQPIAARLRLGFGAMLLMMAGIAAVGLLALQSANQQMREITGAGAASAPHSASGRPSTGAATACLGKQPATRAAGSALACCRGAGARVTVTHTGVGAASSGITVKGSVVAAVGICSRA